MEVLAQSTKLLMKTAKARKGRQMVTAKARMEAAP